MSKAKSTRRGRRKLTCPTNIGKRKAPASLRKLRRR